MTDTARSLRRWGRLIVLATLAMVAYAAPLPDSTWGGECKADWCQPGAAMFEGQRLVDEQVATTPCPKGHILVRGAERNRSVVWSMSTAQVQAINRGETWDNVVTISPCA